MLFASALEGLELRREPDGATRLSGRFPYGKPTILSDGGRRGRPRKEVFAPRAFSYRVEREEEDIHVLFGHDYSKPLASRGARTLTLRDGDDALTFEARITPQIAETTHGRDALALIGSGLAVGLSPGFRIPPERAVKDAEEVTEEPDDGSIDEDGQPRRGALIRTVKAALLYELSVVTRPAFPDATVEARNWTPWPARIVRPAAQRWR